MTVSPDIAVLGAGRMGRGLAHVFAYAGHRVSLIDLKKRSKVERQAFIDETITVVRRSLSDCADAGLFDGAYCDAIMSRVDVVAAADATETLQRANLVFEAVPEVIELKRQAFEFASAHIASDTIVASTTSTILVDELASLIEHPARFINAHWLNPAYIVPLVEVSVGSATSDDTKDKVVGLLKSVGKEPVVCAASPGFIVPRIQALAMNEAARMVEEGVASAEDIDRAIRYGFGFRFAVLGLVEFIDWGGGDILYYASRYLRESLDAPRFEAPSIINENMVAGRLGLKSGSGFYDFDSMDVDAYQRETLKRFVELLNHMGATRPPVIDKDES